MKKPRTPVSPIVKVGLRTAYQIFSVEVRGQQRLSARLGVYWVNPQTGQAVIIPEMDLWNYEEQTRARQAAKKHLEKLAAEFFQQQVSVEYVAQSPNGPPQPRPEPTTPPQGSRESNWNNQPGRQPQPPKPYPNHDEY